MNVSRRGSVTASGSSVGLESATSRFDDAGDLSDAWFERASLWMGPSVVARGRPRSPAPKVAINIRLSPDVLARFKSTGRGWQTRINLALEQWLEAHPEIG